MDDLLQQEKTAFRQGMKLKPELSLSCKEDYYHGMGRAFDDAFNQYARREKKTYAQEKYRLMEPVAERLYAYFQSDSDDFQDCYRDCIRAAQQILGNNRYGLAQKFVNMSLKYLYCYDGAPEREEKFAFCHMPLDKYTIKWVRDLGNRDINRRLAAISNAWANLDESLYLDIQALISKTLDAGFSYRISYHPRAENQGMYTLPRNPLQAEFIIWHQESINEIYHILRRAEPDFHRLGIQMIE